MNNASVNTHPIVEEALKNFFDKSARKEFVDKLSIDTIQKDIAKDSTKDRIVDISTSSQTRFQIDQLITFAETRMDEEKYIQFLIHIGQHTIIAGENPIALEIHEKLVRLCNDKVEMADIRANALLSIGEIYSRQAQ